MRNHYHPQHLAEYIPIAEAKQLKKAGFIAQRDWKFGRRAEEEEGADIKDVKTVLIEQPGRATRRAEAVRVDIDLLEASSARFHFLIAC